MKRFGICILIIILLLVGFWFYLDNQLDKLQNEKDLAVAAAVQSTLDSIKSRRALNPPPVRTHTVYIEKQTPPKKKVEPTPSNVFTDKRDGQEYSFIEINGLLWMADNLNFKSDGSFCYDLEDSKCTDFGRLYTWNSAVNSCPDGWRLPDDEDWKNLIWHNGGIEKAGKELKEGGSSGFNALMAGYRDKNDFYGKIDSSAYFWSATEQNDRYASFRGLYHNFDNVGPYTYTKADAFSVRCVKELE